MPDILRVSTPIANTPPAAQPGSATSTTQVNATQISAANKIPENVTQEDLQSILYDAGSVFQTFADKITETPALAQTLEKLLLGVLVDDNEIALSETAETAPTLLSELAKKLNMNESEILENLLFQREQSTSFSSKLFDVLRDITNADSSEQTTRHIGLFLKALDSYTTAQDTMKNIIIQINNILERIPRSYAANIRTAMGDIIMEPDSEGLAANLQILKEKVLPLLGKYVSITNDLGATRDRIQLLTQEVSKLNLSGKEELAERFTELLDYARYNLNLPPEKLHSLQDLFREVISSHEETKNDFIESLTKALTETENLSTTGKTMINDTITALLLNKSVYMPFNHIFLPFMFDGNFVFTEMWVEKDKYKEGGSSKKEDDNFKRVYLKFDIQKLGKFQAAIGYSDNSIDCIIDYPEGITENQEKIETDIAQIFARNGFTVNSVKTSHDTFKTELEVLHRIYEGRGSINVTV